MSKSAKVVLECLFSKAAARSRAGRQRSLAFFNRDAVATLRRGTPSTTLAPAHQTYRMLDDFIQHAFAKRL